MPLIEINFLEWDCELELWLFDYTEIEDPQTARQVAGVEHD